MVKMEVEDTNTVNLVKIYILMFQQVQLSKMQKQEKLLQIYLNKDKLSLC